MLILGAGEFQQCVDSVLDSVYNLHLYGLKK